MERGVDSDYQLVCRGDATPEQIKLAHTLHDQHRDRSVKKEVLIERYSDTGHLYEDFSNTILFTGHIETAAAAGDMFPTDRENVRILDVAAGTGLAGVELKKMGFRHIDALDPAEGMLAEAKKKGVYEKFYLAGVGQGSFDIENGVYDCITISGMITIIMKDLPLSAWEEIVRLVKPGGYFINTGYYGSFMGDSPDTEDFRQRMIALEKQGKWERVEDRVIEKYIGGQKGVVSIHRIK